jgi:hypothetical protein
MRRRAPPTKRAAALLAPVALVLSVAVHLAQQGPDEEGVPPMPAAPGAQYETNPFIIPLQEQATDELRGGIVVVDVDGDERLDYLVTCPGAVGAYGHSRSSRGVRAQWNAAVGEAG